MSNKLDRASQHISSVLEPVRSWFERIDYAAKSVETGSAVLYETAKTACKEGSKHPIISKVRDEAADTYHWINEKSLDSSKPRILRTKGTAKVLFGISIVAEVLDYIHALEYDLSIAEELRSIIHHWHPTEQDKLSESAMETAKSMNLLLIEYIGYDAFVRAVKKINPEYISCVIQINTDEEMWVSDSPYIHAFDGLDEIHHQMESEVLSEKMNSIGFKLIMQDKVNLPNSKALVRLDFQRIV